MGVQKKPSAMVLIRASMLKTTAKARSAQMNHVAPACSFWYSGVVRHASTTMATMAR